MSQSSRYLPTLDGWRAVAIGLVIFSHASFGFGFGEQVTIGLLGVQLFFGLSGFLITTLLLSEEHRAGAISLTSFYWRRVFRILPAAIVYLLAVGGLGFAGILSVTPGRLISALLFMANYSTAAPSWYVTHFWSLAVEEHFYVVWPALLFLIRGPRHRLSLVLGATIAIAIWRALLWKYRLFWIDPAYFWGRTDVQADCLGFGAAYAIALKDELIGPRLRRTLAHPVALPLAAAIFVLSAIGPTLIADWKLSFAAISVRAAVIPAMLCATLQRPERATARQLDRPAMRLIGLISYSLYLWQQLFLTANQVQRSSWVQSPPINIAAAVCCALLSYNFVEQPMIRVGRLLASRRRNRLSSAARND